MVFWINFELAIYWILLRKQITVEAVSKRQPLRQLYNSVSALFVLRMLLFCCVKKQKQRFNCLKPNRAYKCSRKLPY